MAAASLMGESERTNGGSWRPKVGCAQTWEPIGDLAKALSWPGVRRKFERDDRPFDVRRIGAKSLLSFGVNKLLCFVRVEPRGSRAGSGLALIGRNEPELEPTLATAAREQGEDKL